jgi:uncharacterized phage-like protein YoqJ
MSIEQTIIALPDCTGLTLAFTGHRPPKLSGYLPEVDHCLFQLAYHVLTHCKPDKVISGMALGWDMAVAQAAITMGIHTIAAVPFVNQQAKWPEHSQNRYAAILKKCSKVIVVTEGPYAAWKMQTRNVWMVENSHKLCALWDGTEGGTGNCITAAFKKMDKDPEYSIFNVWDDWQSTFKPESKKPKLPHDETGWSPND